MSEKKWFQTGKDGEAKAEDVQKAIQAGSAAKRRFFLTEGNEAKVTFLDSTGFWLYEHNLRLNGKWFNYFTCLQELDNCPMCDAGQRASYVCVYTVIDHSKYESKKTPGKIITNQKKLMVMKKGAHDKLKDRRDNQCEGDITNCVFRMKRYKREECSTGEDIMFIKRLDPTILAKLIPADVPAEEREDYLKPFNYMELFKPKSAEELRRVVGGAAPVGAPDSFGPASVPDSPTGSAPPAADDLDAYL